MLGYRKFTALTRLQSQQYREGNDIDPHVNWSGVELQIPLMRKMNCMRR